MGATTRLGWPGTASRACAAALALCLGFAAVAVPGRADASGVSPLTATAQDKKRAQARYEEGAKLFEARRYGDALKAFQDSYDIVASPNSHLMLARCLREQNQLIAAYEELERVEQEARQLASSDAGKYGSTVDKAVADREALRKRLGTVTIKVRGDASGAALTVAGRLIPPERLPRPVVVVPGRIDVVGTTQDGRRFARTVNVGAGSAQEVEIDLSPTQPPVTAPPVATTAPTTQPSPADGPADSGGRTSLVPFALIAGGVALATLGVGIAFGAKHLSTYSDWEKTQKLPEAPDGDQDLKADSQREQTIANVCYGVAGGVGAIAGALIAIELASSSGKPKAADSARTPAPKVALGWRSVAISGEF